MVNRRTPTFVVGDVHGQYDKLVSLLRSSGLINSRLGWSGRDATLWFVGDFFDRGSDGVKCVNLVLQLQADALFSGGRVDSLLGNHDIGILSAYFFNEQSTASGGTFASDWLRNGGRVSDLSRLTEEHLTWLTGLSAMAHVDGRLLVHADALFYARYGASLSEVNNAFKVILAGRRSSDWDVLLSDFNERRAFFDSETDVDDPASSFLAAQFLRQFGGSQLVHGHTLISALLNKPDEQVTGPLIYAGGLCVDVDGGMYNGGPGFVYELPLVENPNAEFEAT